PQRRMWEYSSSRACSNAVGITTLRGSRVFAMRSTLLRDWGRIWRGQSNNASRQKANTGSAQAVPQHRWYNAGVSMHDQVYGPERERQLLDLLRALAVRIAELDRAGRLLDAAPELQQLLGNARSELFHYEVRRTYDTPEIAESRRIVEESVRRLH